MGSDFNGTFLEKDSATSSSSRFYSLFNHTTALTLRSTSLVRLNFRLTVRTLLHCSAPRTAPRLFSNHSNKEAFNYFLLWLSQISKDWTWQQSWRLRFVVQLYWIVFHCELIMLHCIFSQDIHRYYTWLKLGLFHKGSEWTQKGVNHNDNIK